MTSLITLLTLFAIVLAVLWTLLPFAVFGTKKKLDKTNELLEALLFEQQHTQNLMKELK